MAEQKLMLNDDGLAILIGRWNLAIWEFCGLVAGS